MQERRKEDVYKRQKEGCERLSFLFATVEWQDNNVIYSVY